MGVGSLLIRYVSALSGQQTPGIHEPACPARRSLITAFLYHGVNQAVGNADGRLSGAEKDHALIRQATPGDPHGGDQSRRRHRTGSLDIVVEHAKAPAIRVQQAKCVGVAKVLQLNQHAGKDLVRRDHELLDQFIVLTASNALSLQPGVEWIVEQLFVIGAHIQHDRKALGGRDAGAGRVKRQLADRDAHAVGAEVPQPEDALSVGDHDNTRLRMRPVAQQLGHPPAVIEADIEAPGSPVDMAELLTGLAHRRGVDKRHHRFDIVNKDAVKKRFISILECDQKQVSLQIRDLLA